LSISMTVTFGFSSIQMQIVPEVFIQMAIWPLHFQASMPGGDCPFQWLWPLDLQAYRCRFQVFIQMAIVIFQEIWFAYLLAAIFDV
jgi:hypothetical protein